MRGALAACAAVLLIAAALNAQSRPPDLSGRWRLVEPTAAERAADTLAITAPDELLIKDTPRAITVEHPSKAGTHPEAGEFEYLVGGSGRINLRGRSNSLDETWGVTHIGTQLMISRSTTQPSDDPSVRNTLARGSMWRLEGRNRLVIDFGEERTGERPKIATRVYVRIAPP
jgi:hypothetical protein